MNTPQFSPAPGAEGVDHEVTCDVLVIGHGCAGVAAALEADHEGAEVIVLEAASAGGGSAALSGGELYLGGGTALQRAAGFVDTPEAMATFLTMALGPGADEERIDEYARGSAEHFDWLVAHGVPFRSGVYDGIAWVPPTEDGLMWLGERAYPYAEHALPAPRGHRVAADGFGGKVLMKQLSEAVAARSIEVHTSTRARELISNGERVSGAYATRSGARVGYRARRGTVLATGGFADNPRLLQQHAPRLTGWGVNSDGGDDGSGILMGQQAGASVRNMAAGQVGIALIPQLMVRGMIVDSLGRRFINEDVYPGLVGIAALAKHDLRVWVILDERAVEEVSEAERWGTRPKYSAESVTELEGALGMPEGSLQGTVSEYNRWAELGQDPYFHKASRWLRPLRPPFAAVDVSEGLAPPEYGNNREGTAAEVFTLGGLRVAPHGAVLDVSGAPIAGLYAAGRVASSMHGGGYISGTSLGDGTFFGRRAGRAAATAPVG